MRHFARLLRRHFVVIGAGGFRIQRQIKLIFPAKLKARFRHSVIADLRAGVPFGEIGGVGGDFVGNQPLFDVFFIR